MPSRFEYERAVRSSDLPPLSRLLALTVATWADVRTGVIPDRLQPSLTTLEGATGMVRASVRKHLDTLEAGGWLKRDRPPVAAARSAKARTKYSIKIPRGAAVADSDGIELGHDVPKARAGDALDAQELGQEMPLPRAGAALALGQEMTPTRAGDALSSSYGPKKSVEYQPQAPAAVAAQSGRGEIQPLIDAMSARGMNVSWTFQSAEWIELRDAVRRVGIPTLVDHAERVWAAAKTQPYSARYFLPGWAGLQTPAAFSGPRPVPADPALARRNASRDVLDQLTEQLRAGGTA
jgi:hypothetical protein